MSAELKTAQPGAESRIRSLLGDRFRFLRIEMEDYTHMSAEEKALPRNLAMYPGWDVGWYARWPAPGSDTGWPGIATAKRLATRAETLTKLFHGISDEEEAWLARQGEALASLRPPAPPPPTGEGGER